MRLTRYKVYSALAAACYRAGCDRQYRLWAIARKLDPHGSGQITLTALQQELNKLRVSGRSPRNVRRLLRGGEGVFWRILQDGDGDPVIRLCSLENTARAVGCAHVGRAVYLAGTMLASLQVFRAAAVRASIEARTGPGLNNPKSRATIERMTGIKRRQQQRYEGALGGRFKTQRNLAPVDPSRGIPLVQHQEGKYTLDPRYRVTHVEGVAVLVKQIPNSYRVNRATVQLAPRGRTRKTNRALNESRYRAAGKRWERRYWDIPRNDPRKANRLNKALATRLGQLRAGEAIYQTGAHVHGLGYRKRLTLAAGPRFEQWHVWTEYAEPEAKETPALDVSLFLAESGQKRHPSESFYGASPAWA